MRKLLLVLTLAGAAACADKLTGPEAQHAAAAYRDQAAASPVLVFVDGIEVDRAQLQVIDQSTIQEIEIIKGAAFVKRFGARAEGKQGAIFVTTKSAK